MEKLVVICTTLYTFSLTGRVVRAVKDFFDCPPSIFASIYALFVLPSIFWGLLETYFHRRKHRESLGSLRGGSMPYLEIPPCKDEILRLSGVDLSARIKSGEITASDVLERSIRRLKVVNPFINAVVAVRFEEAREEAKELDRILRDEKNAAVLRSPLFGVPCVIKECMEMPGLPFTSGVKSRMGYLSGKAPATVVRRAQDHGIIIIGTTNTSEACMFHESNNTVYGLTRNPFDLGRTAGGSSGGAAAAVASFICPVAITSDVGGSTRIPSLYMGLWGHKSTGGSVPNTGTFPSIPIDSLMSRYCQIGATVRHVKDLAPFQMILSGPDGIDQMVRPLSRMAFLPPRNFVRSRANVVIFDLAEPFQSGLRGCARYHPELRKAHDRVVRRLLRSFGSSSEHRVLSVSRDLPELADAFDIWASVLDASRSESFLHTISSGSDRTLSSCAALVEGFRCLIRCNRTCRDGKYEHTLPAVGLGILENFVRLMPARSKRLVRCCVRLRERLNTMLGENGILVAPSLLCPAPRHHENILRIITTGQTGIFNVTQLPATAIPSELRASSGGLPLGVQIIAAEANDWLCMQAAEAVGEHDTFDAFGRCHRGVGRS